jgi:acetyltransferase-like isoleucine patch superfamily enzyme
MSPSEGLRRLPWTLRYRVGGTLASDLRRLVVVATHRHCRVEFRGPVHLGPGFSLWIPGRGTLVVGSGVDFRRDFYCEISGEGTVTIGDGSIFTGGAMIQCSTEIAIGRRCVFSQSVLIADGKHRSGSTERHILDQGYDYSPVHIGDGATVMAKCTITADIGAGAFVGANSAVIRPVPPLCLAVGSPAVPVRYFGDTPSGAMCQPVHD